MSKLVRVEYRITSRACHWVEVPDWFDPKNEQHAQLLTENEELHCEDYQHEEVVDCEVTGVHAAPNESGGMDFTDLEQP
jgi:hypothetical protein